MGQMKICNICNTRPVLPDELHCGDSSCIDFSTKLLQEISREYKQQRNKALKALWKNGCLEFSVGKRIWYKLKGTICILLDLYSKEHDTYGDVISEAAVWDIGPSFGEHGGEEWMSLTIGKGIFKNWNYEIYPDQSY